MTDSRSTPEDHPSETGSSAFVIDTQAARRSSRRPAPQPRPWQRPEPRARQSMQALHGRPADISAVIQLAEV